MNRKSAAAAFALGLLCLPTAFASADTPNCDALEAHSDETGPDIHLGIDFDGGDLVFRQDGEPHMVITDRYELYLDGERIALDAAEQQLVTRYYLAIEDIVDEAMDLAGDATGLGVAAAIEALALAFRGDEEMDAFEARVEAQADEIEAQADRICMQAREVETLERQLAERVPAFRSRFSAQ